MRLTFRPIQQDEIAEASRLVDAAYAPQMREIYGDSPRGRWRHYDEAKIESYVEREAEGVRVGLWEDRIVTFNVCRSYGNMGWFHTLAVHPQFQGRGCGRQAVEDAETYLTSRGVGAIALMTWPTAIKNLAFYQRQGYRLTGLSVYAYRGVEGPAIAPGVSPFYAHLYASLSPQEQDRAQNAIRALCQKISMGLDYSQWVTWAHRQSFAETLLLWRNGRLEALATSYFFPNAHWAEGKLLLLHPGMSVSDKLWVLEHLKLWAISHNRTTFGLSVDLASDFASAILLPSGFRFFAESMATMVKGDAPPDPGLHFVRFGG